MGPVSMLWVAKQVPPEFVEKARRDSSLVQRLLDASVAGGAGVLDLDKAWNGVHWLLALDMGPTDAPESKIIYGGTEIGEDLGYGPARYLTAQEVREASEALDRLPRDTVAKRFNPAEMDEAGVYPSGWVGESQEGLRWLLEGYDRLVPYMRDAAARGNALVTFLF